MEECIVTKTQNGEGVKVQNQGDADRFFFMSMELSTQTPAHPGGGTRRTSTPLLKVHTFKKII